MLSLDQSGHIATQSSLSIVDGIRSAQKFDPRCTYGGIVKPRNRQALLQAFRQGDDAFQRGLTRAFINQNMQLTTQNQDSDA